MNTIAFFLRTNSILAFCVACLVTMSGVNANDVCDQQVDVDWAKRAAETTWDWPEPEREPSLFLCMMRVEDPYKIVLEHTTRDEFLVRVLRDSDLRLEFPAHSATQFAVCQGKFVYTKFKRDGNGCTVLAFDLEAKKQLWVAELEGIGPIAHAAYGNRVHLGILYRVVWVYGWEWGGKYLEYLDLNTGKVLGHRVFEKGFK